MQQHVEKNHHTEIFTYFTRPTGRSELLYSAEDWTLAILQLETAGPVSVSTRQDVTPVLSGKGIILPTTGNTAVRFQLAPGDRLFIAAEAVNRVKVIFQPIPYLQRILTSIERGFSGIKGIFGAVVRTATKKAF